MIVVIACSFLSAPLFTTASRIWLTPLNYFHSEEMLVAGHLMCIVRFDAQEIRFHHLEVPGTMRWLQVWLLLHLIMLDTWFLLLVGHFILARWFFKPWMFSQTLLHMHTHILIYTHILYPTEKYHISFLFPRPLSESNLNKEYNSKEERRYSLFCCSCLVYSLIVIHIILWI